MEKLIKRLEHEYIFKVQDFYPYQNIWCLDTSKGKKCLKKIRYSREDALFIWLATENLVRNGFVRFNRFLLTKRGEPFLETESGLFAVSEWITGRTADYTDPALIGIAAATLAELHIASQNFYPPVFGRHRIKWGYWIDNFAERLDELKKFKRLAAQGTTFFDEMYLRHADAFIEEAEEAIAYLKKSAYFELVEIEQKLNGFCHHDYAYHNVIIKDGKGYLIDFDYLICDLRCHDIASFMMRTVKDNGWQTLHAAKVLEKYNVFSPLRKGERDVMWGFLKFPQDFWQAGYTFYIEKNRPQERMEKRLKNCITTFSLRQKCLKEMAEFCCGR